jgi:hypothetical protein
MHCLRVSEELVSLKPYAVSVFCAQVTRDKLKEPIINKGVRRKTLLPADGRTLLKKQYFITFNKQLSVIFIWTFGNKKLNFQGKYK